MSSSSLSTPSPQSISWEHVPPALLPPSRFRVVPEAHLKLPRPQARPGSPSDSLSLSTSVSASPSRSSSGASDCSAGSGQSDLSVPSAIFSPALWPVSQDGMFGGSAVFASCLQANRRSHVDREEPRSFGGFGRRLAVVDELGGTGMEDTMSDRSGGCVPALRALSEVQDHTEREAVLKFAISDKGPGSVRSFTFAGENGCQSTGESEWNRRIICDRKEKGVRARPSKGERQVRSLEEGPPSWRFWGMRKAKGDRMYDREEDSIRRKTSMTLGVRGGWSKTTQHDNLGSVDKRAMDAERDAIAAVRDGFKVEVKREKLRPFSGRLVVREAKSGGVMSRFLRRRKAVVV